MSWCGRITRRNKRSEITVGAAAWRRGMSPEGVFAEADRAMYADKEQGGVARGVKMPHLEAEPPWP